MINIPALASKLLPWGLILSMSCPKLPNEIFRKLQAPQPFYTEDIHLMPLSYSSVND